MLKKKRIGFAVLIKGQQLLISVSSSGNESQQSSAASGCTDVLFAEQILDASGMQQGKAHFALPHHSTIFAD